MVPRIHEPDSFSTQERKLLVNAQRSATTRGTHMPWAARAAWLLLTLSAAGMLVATVLRSVDSPLADRPLVLRLRDIAWPLTVMGFSILGIETHLFRSRALALIDKLSRGSDAEQRASLG